MNVLPPMALCPAIWMCSVLPSRAPPPHPAPPTRARVCARPRMDYTPHVHTARAHACIPACIHACMHTCAQPSPPCLIKQGGHLQRQEPQDPERAEVDQLPGEPRRAGCAALLCAVHACAVPPCPILPSISHRYAVYDATAVTLARAPQPTHHVRLTGQPTVLYCTLYCRLQVGR